MWIYNKMFYFLYDMILYVMICLGKLLITTLSQKITNILLYNIIIFFGNMEFFDITTLFSSHYLNDI